MTAGRITQSQADTRASGLQAKVPTQVDEVRIGRYRHEPYEHPDSPRVVARPRGGPTSRLSSGLSESA